jgi:hypothetical protein
MMKKIFFIGMIICAAPVCSIAANEDDVSSPTEGVITTGYVGEDSMKTDCLRMLAKFSTYMKSIYTDAGNNSEGTAVGYFKANSAGQDNEDGVRTNTDMSMICSFLYKYARPKGIALPAGITYDDLRTMALRSLAWAYSTHNSNKLKSTTNSSYWGSVWESSLWTESLGFSAWMLDNELSETDKTRIKNVILAEANYDLNRTIPTGYNGDTKAEENGWETNILSIACALYPGETTADKYYLKMQQFASNCYSMGQDASDTTSVAGHPASYWYLGTNLFNDYTLQNHNYFHTSYQNVVIEELCESYLAMKLMQQDNGSTKKFELADNLLWNQKPVFDNVLKELALADGELAMPNGNDWSLFLYDQLPCYTAMATIFRDPDALMLENMAFKYTKARQSTTVDGSWMLNSDIGPRRMGVTAHRVMMTYLLHDVFSVGDMQPTAWNDYYKKHSTTKYFFGQNIIKGMSKDRFTCFSWSTGIPDYSGIIVPNTPDKNKIIVPFKTHHTGNLIGVYNRSDYTASLQGQYAMFPKAWAMNGVVNAVGGTIPQAFVLYSTSGNAVIMLDALKASAATTVSVEQGGMMGISVDPFMKTKRTIYYDNNGTITNIQVDGSTESKFTSTWANIDNQIGFVCKKDNNQMGFADRSLNNSIYTAKIYPSYWTESSAVPTTMNHIRNFVYYSNVTAEQTKVLEGGVQDLTKTSGWTTGWHGVVVPDPDGTNYLLLSNLFGSSSAFPISITCEKGAPIFTHVTDITGNYASASFTCVQNYNITNELKVFISGATKLQAVQADENSRAAYIYNNGDETQKVNITIIDEDGNQQSNNITIVKGAQIYVSIIDGTVTATTADFPGDYRNVVYGTHAYASSQEGSHLPFSVIDGNDDTFYKSLANASSGNEFLAFRMRNLYKINKVVMTPMEGETAPTSITVQYSQTDDSYANVPNVTTTTDGDKIVVSFPEVQARFVKVKLNGSSNRVAVKKLAVYGKPAESTFVPPIPTTAITSTTKDVNVKKRAIYKTDGTKVKNFTVPGCYIIQDKMTDGTTQIRKEIKE